MIEFASLSTFGLHDSSIDTNVFVTNVVGLTGIPTIRGVTIPRPEEDGDVEPANQYLSSRTSVWDIAVFGATMALAEATWQQLNYFLLQAVRQPKTLRWRMVGSSLNLEASVRVASVTPPTFTSQSSGPWYLGQVTFRHADPNNYDQVATTQITAAPSVNVTGITWPVTWPVPWALIPSGAGTISVINSGNSWAWPVIDITGSITNPIVQNSTTGQALYFDGLALVDGQTLSIGMNPANRYATIAGVSQFASLRFSASEFFPISPSATEQISFTGQGTDVNTTMTVTLQSAYIT